MIRNSIYIYSLLHDLGEILVMYGIIKNKDELYDVSEFIKKHHEALKNHNDKEILWRLTDLAHNIAIFEENREENKLLEKDIRLLRPIFSYIAKEETMSEGLQITYAPRALDLENIFPITNDQVNNEERKKLFSAFLNALKFVKDEEQLLYLLEKYLWCIPTTYSNSYSDISLYDHLKTSAALSLCLYQQYLEGQWRKENLDSGEKDKENQFLLINGDISGIQNFIFNIPSKGAAKSLKGRSVYIQLINDVIVHHLLSKLQLKKANLLYQGGGNFYILAPATKIKVFEKARKDILEVLLQTHDGELYVAMDAIFLSPADFQDFSKEWDRVKEKVNLQKLRKWTEIGLKENYNMVFGPLNDGSSKEGHCKVCGTILQASKIKIDEEMGEICSFCHSFVTLTNQIKDAKYYIFIEEENKLTSSKARDHYQDIFRAFGCSIEFSSHVNDTIKKNHRVYKLNDTNFLAEGCTGFRFGAFSLPMEKHEQLTFEDLAEKSEGDKKIALLKLDIDNLGYLFNKGLSNNKSISRVATLSRMLGLYFEGYINKLIKTYHWDQSLYTVFSGGDDTFILGSWNVVLAFAERFYKDFKKYVCNNEGLTFSAGIGLYHFKFPIVRSAVITEDALEKSKKYLSNGERIPTKNKVTIFGETFNWEEFAKIKEIKEIIIEMMEIRKGEKDDGFGRNLLYKLYKSTVGLRPILDTTAEGRFENIRFWRLAYYLRDLQGDNKNKEIDYAEKFIKIYRQIAIDNLVEKNKNAKIRNVMIIPAAIKWAELQTRRVMGNER